MVATTTTTVCGGSEPAVSSSPNEMKHDASSSSTSSSSSSSLAFYASLGDKAHALTLLSSLTFCYCVLGYMNDESSTLFDAQWKREGFCVTNKEVPYWNSHDACLYFDSVAAAVCCVLYLALRNAHPGMEPANQLFIMNAAGIFFHGLGHGGIGQAIREGTVGNEESNDSPGYALVMQRGFSLQLVIQIALGLSFYVALLKASLPNVSMKYIPAFAVPAILVGAAIPNKLGFTYVQTILMVAFSVNQLIRPTAEKDFCYATYPLVVGLPITIVGWLESTCCQAFVRDVFYGHLIYDGFIPVGSAVWYVLCYLYVTGTVKVRIGSSSSSDTSSKVKSA